MRVLVYGGGAVGLGLASALLAAGERVEVVARPKTAAALSREGLLRRGLFGSHAAPPGSFGAFASLGEAPAQYPLDCVCVCVKSFDTAAAADDLAAHAGRLGRAPVVLFQNGWGNAEVFAARFPAARVFSARVITGFRRPRAHEVDVTVHAAPVRLGSLFGADPAVLEPLARALAAGGLPCEATGEIGRDLWAKMLYNCALNPLGAVLRVPYGALGEHPASRRLLRAVVGEVFAVMGAAGHRTHWESADAYWEAFAGQMLPATAAHESSMLQDLRAGRRTEIEALTGEVLRLGAAHGVAVPVTATLDGLVRFAEDAARRARD